MKLSAKVIAPLAVFAVASVVMAIMISAQPATESNRPSHSAPLVRVQRVEPAPVQLWVSAQGTVEPRTESELVTEVSGRIVWVSPQLAAGGFFAAGELLVRVDRRDYDIALEGAKAALARAESNLVHASSTLGRQQSMRATGASSRSRLDDASHAKASAEAGLREAQVAVRRAELDLERSEIRAPFAGRVREKRVDVGQFVGRGVPVARVYSIDYAEVRLPISDADIAYLDLPLGFRHRTDEAPGPGSLTALAEPPETPAPRVVLSAEFAGERLRWQGQVVRTEGALDPRTRMLNVVARVDDPYGRRSGASGPPLPIGLFVEASIEGRLVDAVYELPRSALRHDREVLVVDADGRLRIREVAVLRSEQDTTWIRSGLRSGELVVTSALEVVIDGMQVRTRESGPQSDAAVGLDSSSSFDSFETSPSAEAFERDEARRS